MKNRRAAKPQGEFLSQIHAMLGQWDKADPSSFGLTDAHVQRLKDDYEKAAAAHARVLALQAQLTQAMAAKKSAMGDLRRTFGGLSTIIDGMARAMRDPGVYTRAAIDQPKKKGPLPKPAAPTGLKIKPKDNGQLELTFEIVDKGRGNLMYEVRRQCEWLDGRDAPWEPVDVTPRRKVVDNDVPSGLRAIRYQVRAKRTNGTVGEWSSEKIFPFGSIASAKKVAVPAVSAEAGAESQVEAKTAGAATACGGRAVGNDQPSTP
ncbi:MAG: hypothetical protein ACIAS6_10505 [Phycisphaerales bacterium JB060]